tara:strand:- start:61 stop:189 length:129 start_codon:yes stop_codon:yes gene_type:complete
MKLIGILGSIGEYMKYTNVQRNYNNICPDLLMKNITGKEWAY